jgi:tripartite-type tricarboxylate transporter receptor subunit TctC
MKELIALSKQKDLNFAVSGTGGAPHLAGVALAQAVGARWQYVPYKGGSQAITDTVGGQTQVMMNGMLATYPHVQSGKLKLLAVSKRTRMPLIADVPTIAEQGVPGFESGSWQGVLVAKGTPDAIVQRLNAELVRAIRSPDVRARLAGQGAEVVTMTPQEQDQFFAAERKRWEQVVTSANIKAE